MTRSFLLLAALVLLVGSNAQLDAQAFPSRSGDPLGWRPWSSQPGGFPDSVVQRVRRDADRLALYEDALAGRGPWPEGADTSAVLFWLAEGRRPQSIPALERFAREATRERVSEEFAIAAYGLMLAADSLPAAREAVERLIRAELSERHQRVLVRLLFLLGGPSERSILLTVAPQVGWMRSHPTILALRDSVPTRRLKERLY